MWEKKKKKVITVGGAVGWAVLNWETRIKFGKHRLHTSNRRESLNIPFFSLLNCKNLGVQNITQELLFSSKREEERGSEKTGSKTVN